MSAMKCVIGTTLLILSAGAFAGESAGSYMTFVRAASESTLPDGSRSRLIHYYHAGVDQKGDSPFAGKTSECVGRMILSSAGRVIAGSGFCFAQDATGNGGSWTWKVTDAATENCPQVCGTFQWAEGYGNTKGASASGVWRQTYGGKDGGTGTYTVKYTP